MVKPIKPRTTRGAAPRQWATTPDSLQAWRWYVNGQRQECDDLQHATEQAKQRQGFVWLGLKDPTDEDMTGFAQQFDLHPLAIEDAVEGHSRSKLEQFGATLFMVISTVAFVEHASITEAAEIVSTGQIMVFLGEHFVLTVRRGETTPLNTVRDSLEADPQRMSEGSHVVLYALLDRIVDDYQAVVAEFEEDVDEVDELVFSPDGAREVDRVYLLKRELIEFKRAVAPLGAPLQALATRNFPMLPESARAYFRELADHHTEARESISSFEEVLSTLLQAALARVSVADNDDLRKMSAAVAILAVPTLLSGIYGMNFSHMPELAWKYGYFALIGVMAMLMALTWWLFRHNKWL